MWDANTVWLKSWSMCLLLFLLQQTESASLQEHEDPTYRLQSLIGSSYTYVVLAAVACVSLLLLVFVLAVCGGCTAMEVGSESHAACAYTKSGDHDDGYIDISLNANSHVFDAGHTLNSDDAYHPQSQALPYASHPQALETQAFTGYRPIGQAGQNPTAPSAGTDQHHWTHTPAGYTEAPPPNYDEAIGRETRPSQSYGW